jgi:hypothetical protein
LVRGFLQCLSTTAREELYDRCRGDAEFPTCNICGQLILVGDAWDESHDPEGAPHCFGGTETGVAHRACDRRHGAEVVRPLDAKATRNRQKHVCAFQTRHKLPGDRMDWRKRKVEYADAIGVTRDTVMKSHHHHAGHGRAETGVSTITPV